jgi:hypothetical protein
MVRFAFMKGEVSPLVYVATAPLLLLSQHGMVALAYRWRGIPLVYDQEFWLLPLRRLAVLPGLSPLAAGLAFAFSLAVLWVLAWLSFRRASRARWGYGLAALSIVPVLQLPAVAVLAFMPRRAVQPEAEAGEEREGEANASHIAQGVLAGVAIIVFAVLVSAVTFGAYGWGLFVITPFTVGLTTAHIANRRTVLDLGSTVSIALSAAALGSLALVMFALEGIACIVMAAPLGAGVAAIGAAIGRSVAIARQDPRKPFLAVAFLPAVFALEAAMPPSVTIATDEAIIISAPPSTVWRELTSDEPINAPIGLVGQAGLAVPLRARITGEGVGAERLGEFSTGIARERVTAWVPERRLAFTVLEQPPAMEEMSPYRRVHAPHVRGYFDTGETRFDLEPLPGGQTRLTVRASHVLRIDPVLYWEPIARWAVRENAGRVLRAIRERAESEP